MHFFRKFQIRNAATLWDLNVIDQFTHDGQLPCWSSANTVVTAINSCCPALVFTLLSTLSRLIRKFEDPHATSPLYSLWCRSLMQRKVLLHCRQFIGNMHTFFFSQGRHSFMFFNEKIDLGRATRCQSCVQNVSATYLPYQWSEYIIHK